MAQDPSTRNEQRRLQRILADETYGPALVRLGKTQQREILDLISEGDSRRTRERLLQLDKERREHVRVRSLGRRQDKRWRTAPGVKVTPALIEARAKMDRLMRKNSHFRTIDKWEANARKRATPEDLRFIIDHTDDEILDRAAADRDLMRDGELEYSAMWYHWH